MADEIGLKFIISALDTAVKPIKDLAKTVDSTVKPVRTLGKELKKALNVTGIPRLATSIKGMGKELKSTADAAMGLVGKMGLLGGGLLGGGLALFKTQLLDVATGNQQLERELQRVTGTAQGAKDALGWLGQYAKETRRPVEELAAAYISLRREGLNPQAKAMQQVADLAGATGASIEEATKAVVDARKGQSDALAELLGAKKISKGNYDVFEFTGADGQIKRLAALRDKAADMQKLIDRSFELKGFEGGAKKMSNSWDGLIQGLLNFKQHMASLVMSSGVFDLIQGELAGFITCLDEMEKTGELKKEAEKWAKALCSGIQEILKGARSLWDWIKDTFIPGFIALRDFMGGWENMAIGLGAVLAGPLLASLASLTSAVFSLGAAILATPVGWVMAAIAGIAAGVYMIIKNWSTIKSFFSGLWGSVTGTMHSAWEGITGYLSGKFTAITSAFNEGVVNGIMATLLEFHPVTFIAEGINAISKYLFGVDLSEAGVRMVKNWSKITSFFSSLWGSVKVVFSNAWNSLTGTMHSAWEGITGYLSGKFTAITSAFNEGVVNGIMATLLEFHPVTFIAEGINAISKYLFGVDLSEAGVRMVGGIWDGMKSMWADLQAWLYSAWENLTSWLPDKVKDMLGMGAGTPSGGMQNSGAGEPSVTRAAAVMAKAGPAALAGGGPAKDQTVRTEVLIRAENLPQGMSVEADKKQADRTSINCGYAMAGI